MHGDTWEQDFHTITWGYYDTPGEAADVAAEHRSNPHVTRRAWVEERYTEGEAV
jgi:hypothetical protein